jgi:MFS family permease
MCATFAAFADNFVYFVISLWLILFLGGSVLPACSGMLVSIVPRRHRPTSSSLSVFFFNMFGYFFSVFLSGYFMDVSFLFDLAFLLILKVEIVGNFHLLSLV